MTRSLLNWFEILSDLLVNLSSGWFALILLEPGINPKINFWILTNRFFFGILSLSIAKYLKDKSKNL